MSRDATARAQDTYRDQRSMSRQYGNQANGIYDTLVPKYTQMAFNPQGFGAPAVSEMKTSAGQSAGGSAAGAVGQGNLEAARTGNAGEYQYGLAKSMREGANAASDAGLKVDIANEGLKEDQRSAGLGGLSHLWGKDVDTAAGELNAENESTRNAIEAGKSGWFQNMMALMNTSSNMASNMAQAAKG